MMICSECGVVHSESEFLTAKKEGCRVCKNDWFYVDNVHNQTKVAEKLKMAAPPKLIRRIKPETKVEPDTNPRRSLF